MFETFVCCSIFAVVLLLVHFVLRALVRRARREVHAYLNTDFERTAFCRLAGRVVADDALSDGQKVDALKSALAKVPDESAELLFKEGSANA